MIIDTNGFEIGRTAWFLGYSEYDTIKLRYHKKVRNDTIQEFSVNRLGIFAKTQYGLINIKECYHTQQECQNVYTREYP